MKHTGLCTIPTKMFLDPCEIYGSKLHMAIGTVVSRESSSSKATLLDFLFVFVIPDNW